MTKWLNGDDLYNYVMENLGGKIRGRFFSIHESVRKENRIHAVKHYSRDAYPTRFEHISDARDFNVLIIDGVWFITEDGINFVHPNNKHWTFKSDVCIALTNPDLDE